MLPADPPVTEPEPSPVRSSQPRAAHLVASRLRPSLAHSFGVRPR